MHKGYELLVLDYGGVYSFEYTAGEFNQFLLDTFGVTPDDEQLARIVELSHELGANQITTTEYVPMMGKILGVDELPTVEAYEEAVIAMGHPPSPAMKALVEDVRAQGIKVSLLSDMYTFELERNKPTGRFDGFDYTSFSADEGMTKYESEFFKRTLGHFGVAAENVLFVDDLLRNIEVAQSLGMRALYVDRQEITDVNQLVEMIYANLGVTQPEELVSAQTEITSAVGL